MALHEQFKTELKEALKARAEVKLAVIRSVLAALTAEVIAQKHPPQEMLDDAKTLMVIKRLVNQRKDSIEQFKKGKREDLATAEEAELKILETYLPQTMSRDEIRPIAESKKAAMHADASKKGMLIGALMKDLAGRADGADVKAVVDSLFI